MRQIRQGDVLLIERPAPKKATRVPDVQGLRVPGERTGHAHELPAEVFDAGGTRLLHLPTPAVLTHEEHEHVEIPSGWWQPVLQREFARGASPASRARYD